MSKSLKQEDKSSNQWRIQIAAHGRINIPASLRKAAHIKDGDEVVLTLKEDNTIEIQPLDQAIAEMQALVAKHFGDEDLMAEIRAMRQNDAARAAKKLQSKE